MTVQSRKALNALLSLVSSRVTVLGGGAANFQTQIVADGVALLGITNQVGVTNHVVLTIPEDDSYGTAKLVWYDGGDCDVTIDIRMVGGWMDDVSDYAYHVTWALKLMFPGVIDAEE